MRGKRILRRTAFFVALASAVAELLAPATASAAASPPIFVTTFRFGGSGAVIPWLTCGISPTGEGCFGSGSLGPFARACAVLEDAPRTKGGTTAQIVYVLDAGTSNPSLAVFSLTATVLKKSGGTTVASTLVKTVPLSLPGGAGVSCFMSANNTEIVLATSKATTAVSITKSDFSTSTIGGFSPPIPVAGVTANAAGYITVAFGSNAGTGFVVVPPPGGYGEDGGGAYFMPNTINGVNPTGKNK